MKVLISKNVRYNDFKFEKLDRNVSTKAISCIFHAIPHTLYYLHEEVLHVNQVLLLLREVRHRGTNSLVKDQEPKVEKEKVVNKS